MRAEMNSERTATVERNTKETQIRVCVNLDGTGKSDVNTGLGFLDHMLDQLTFHGLLDLEVRCKGDLHIDGHHSTEDIALALGQAIREALGDKQGIQRFQDFSVEIKLRSGVQKNQFGIRTQCFPFHLKRWRRMVSDAYPDPGHGVSAR